MSAKEHNPILPQPQKLTYGNGQLTLRGIGIALPSTAVEEDRFAARELASFLREKTGLAIPVKNTTGIAIKLQRTGNVGALPLPGEKPGARSRESYSISVSAKGVQVTSPSSAGIYYAVQTLTQLVQETGDKAFIPYLELQDWPSLAYRGFMMDMSHMQFPQVDEIKKQLDFLARWKTNQYFFYSEASIELEGYPLLMANARYTKAQIKDIIAYARARHIDVVPNMELYGHLHDLFKLEHYADLSVNRYGGEFKPRDPRVRPILNDWITQISALFPSPFFHIGFDETWVIELEAKKLNQTEDELYLDMLNQTTNMVEKQGKQPLVWADMLQKFHRIIPKISKKVTAVPWHYFPLKEAEYDTLLSPFAKENIPMVVQSASINWHWFYPAFDISFRNNNMLITAGRKYNAVGYINSGWTDDPQTLMRLSRPDMAHGSIAAWQAQPVDSTDFFRKYNAVLYPIELAKTMEQAHLALLKSQALIKKAMGETDTMLWEDPFTTRGLKIFDNHREALHEARLAAEEAQVFLRQALRSGVDSVTLATMLVGAKQLDLISMKYLYAGEIASMYNNYRLQRNAREFRMLLAEVTAYYHSKTVDMFDAIVETKEMFRKAWLNEYTDFRLGIPMAKFDMELQYWFKVRKRLDALRGFKDTEPFPELQVYLKGD